MKRKFFSLMVAACAALFSFSGLTGCSGGGDDEQKEAAQGYMTYKDWVGGAKMFRIGGMRVAFDLSPYVSNIPTKPNAGGVSVLCKLSQLNQNAVQGENMYVKYTITARRDGKPLAAEGFETALPLRATLELQTVSPNMAQMIIKAFTSDTSSGDDDSSSSGGDPSEMTINLEYSTPGAGGTSELSAKVGTSPNFAVTSFTVHDAKY